MDIKVISRNVGQALLISALFMFFSLIVSVANGKDSAFGPLAISFIITFVVGIFPFIFVRKASSISLQDGFMIIVRSWLLSFIFGMLPYVLWGGEFTLINAWFESVSGYTTTGSTILTNVEGLPDSLIFWRSSTHFIGGLGVVVFLLLIIPDASPFRMRLTNMELSSLSREGYRFRSIKTVHVIAFVYVGLAAVETLLLMLAGMSFFDAVNHSFSTVATGGFSTKNASIAYYDSVAIDIILIVFMILSSIHFGLLFGVFASRSLKPFRHPVVRFFLGTILLLTVLVSISLKVSGTYSSWGNAILDSAFQVTTFITTTGFGTADNNGWPVFANILLLYAAFQCGCSGSTTGGVKSDRMYIVFKSIARQVKQNLHPSSIMQLRVGNHFMKDDAASAAVLYIVFYMIVLMISFLLLVMFGVDVSEAFSGALTSLGNAGPGLGSISTMGNYASQLGIAKFIYSVDMILGRLEIYPMFIVFSLIFKRSK